MSLSSFSVKRLSIVSKEVWTHEVPHEVVNFKSLNPTEFCQKTGFPSQFLCHTVETRDGVEENDNSFGVLDDEKIVQWLQYSGVSTLGQLVRSAPQ